MIRLAITVIVLCSMLPTAVYAQDPTPMPTPTPMPARVWIDGVGVLDTSSNAVQFVASVWSVLILYLFYSLVWHEVKMQNMFLLVVCASMPIVIVNAAWWALTVWVFVGLCSIVVALTSIVKR